MNFDVRGPFSRSFFFFSNIVASAGHNILLRHMEYFRGAQAAVAAAAARWISIFGVIHLYYAAATSGHGTRRAGANRNSSTKIAPFSPHPLRFVSHARAASSDPTFFAYFPRDMFLFTIVDPAGAVPPAGERLARAYTRCRFFFFFKYKMPSFFRLIRVFLLFKNNMIILQYAYPSCDV